MAIIHSVVIGRGRKSLGQVTLKTMGGVCIGSQRILRNSSNTERQQLIRRRWRDTMSTAGWMAPLAAAAYSRKGADTAWSRLLHWVLYSRRDFQYDYSAARAGAVGFETLTAYGDFPLSDGKVKISTAQYLLVTNTPLMLFTIQKNLQTLLNIEEGDSVEVDVQWFMSAARTDHDIYSVVPTSGGHPMAVGIYDYETYFVVALQMPAIETTSTEENHLKSAWPVLRLNGQRFGMRALTYFAPLMA